MTELQELLYATPLASATPQNPLLERFSRRTIAPGTVVVSEGEDSGKLAVIADGVLRASRHLTNDRELPVFFLKRGDYFGFLPFLDGGPCPLTLIATTKATVYILERRLFDEFLSENPEFARQLLARLAGRLRACLDQLGTLGRPGAIARLAAALSAELPEDAERGAVIGWPMRQSQLADALGIAPENLSRALVRLERLGIVKRLPKHQLRVDDPLRLRAAAERSLVDLDGRQ